MQLGNLCCANYQKNGSLSVTLKQNKIKLRNIKTDAYEDLDFSTYSTAEN